MTTVLVVDDEYLIVEVLTLALEDVGFMVMQNAMAMRHDAPASIQ